MRILLIEDDDLFGSGVSRYLQREGFAVDWITDAAGFQSAMNHVEYDAVLLDLGLPDGSGEECVVAIRASNDHLPVIVLTARDAVRERVALLDMGADDYLVKPVDLAELCSRLTAITRRVQHARGEGDLLKHGALQLIASRRVATWNGEIVPLTARQFWLLEVFLRKKGQVLSRERLEEALYGWGQEVGSNTVEVYIHYLRKKFHPQLIVTVRGAGYKLGETIDEVSAG